MPSQPAATPCPLCGSGSRRQFATHGYDVRDCEACGHRFADHLPEDDHAQAVYGDAYFNGGGAGYADYLSSADLLHAHGRRYAAIVGRHAAPGRLLDVGAAAGYVLRGWLDAGWQGCGIEPNDTMARHARDTLGLDVRCTTAERLRTDERFDLVSMVQVVAHLSNPLAALDNLARVTRTGGLWLIETWDYRSWTARLAGEHWHEYSPPSVLHWFTRRTLTALVGRFGFEVVAHGRPRKQISGAHAKSLLRYKFEHKRVGPVLEWLSHAVPDRAVLTYPAEDLFWILCGKV